MIRQRHLGQVFLLGLSLFLLGGCSIWDSYPHPDYDSSRADRVCHPYGDCLQGEWVAKAGSGEDSAEARVRCLKQVAGSHGNGWWEHSVTRGLEIKECMEKEGYVLKQAY